MVPLNLSGALAAAAVDQLALVHTATLPVRRVSHGLGACGRSWLIMLPGSTLTDTPPSRIISAAKCTHLSCQLPVN